MKRYEKYKDSGIEWIGEIPEGWEVVPLKSCTEIVLGKMLCSMPPKGQEILYTEEKYLKSKNIGWLELLYDDNNVESMWFTEQEKKQYLIKEGDVLVNEGGDIGHVCIWKEQSYPCYIQNSVHKITPKDNVHSNYLQYIIYSISKRGYFWSIVSQISIAHLTKEKLKNTCIVLPSFSEQHVIADYLDAKCAKIDKVIATQEKRVELLKELKQSIITHAVTRGINPDVKLKDSGVEWIGMIPEHWEVMRMNELGKYKKGPFGSALKVTMFVRKGKDTVKVYQQQNAINKDWQLGDDYIDGSYYREYMQGFTVDPRDIIVSCAGTIGECYIIPDNIEKGIINQALMKMKMDERKVILEYFLILFDIMLKEESTKSSNGSAMKNIPPFDIMKKMLIPLPSKEEQKYILKALKERTDRIDSSMSKALRQIELLKEYKQSLITEVVTGKRKVC